MFKNVLVSGYPNHSIGEIIDIGALIEAMLFYKKTTLYTDESGLRELINKFGANEVLELIEEYNLDIVLSTDIPVVYEKDALLCPYLELLDKN